MTTQPTTQPTQPANNVHISTDTDGNIVIRINPRMTLGLSKSGKSNMVASTNGFTRIVTNTGMVSVSMNVIRDL